MKMNRQSKTWMITIILLSMTLIGLTVIFIIKGGFKGGSVTWLVIVIALAVIAILVAFLARYLQERKLRHLPEAYKIAYDRIMQYIGMTSLKWMDKQEVGRDLIDMFTLASQANKQVEDVIGNEEDVTAFADEILSAHGMKNNFTNHMLLGVQYFIIYLFVIQGYNYFRDTSVYDSYFKAEVDYTTILFFALVALVIVPLLHYYLKRAMIKQSSAAVYLIPFLVIPIGISALFIGTMELIKAKLLHIKWVDKFYSGAVAVVPNPYVLALLGIVFVGIIFLKRKVNRIPYDR